MEEPRDIYKRETGKDWRIIPYTHGNVEFASWDYQLWLEDNMISKYMHPLRESIEEVLREDKISLTTKIIEDLGADSLDVITLIFNLEKKFGITFDEESLYSKNDITIEEILILIETLKK